MGHSDLFAAYVHHDGEFVRLEKHEFYAGGECEGTFDLDPEKFGFFDAIDLVERLGYSTWSKLWYKIPSSNSYRVLKTDKEVMSMLSYLKPNTRVLHLFVEGGKIDEVPTSGSVAYEKECENGGSVANGKTGQNKRSVGENEKNEDEINESDKDGDNITNEIGNDTGQFHFDLGVDGNEGTGQFEFDMGVDENNGENWNEGDLGDESSEDGDYYPCDGESSDDNLDDTELASEDEEYIESRQNVRTGKNIFDLIDQDTVVGLGYNQGFENVESEYESSDGEVCSDSTDEEFEGRRNKKFRSSYDPRTKPKDLVLKLGMRFEDGFQCRRALKDNAIEDGKFIKFGKVAKHKCEAKCRPPCEWRVYASVVQDQDIFIIKTYNPKHTCTRKNNNKLVSSNWIAQKYLNVFRVNPNLPIKHLEEDIRRRFKTIVGKDRLYRARSLSQDMIRGSVEDHYALLRRYVAELIRVDREGKYKLFLGEGALFKGLYIGHSAMRNGFKKSCRPVIGLDGCFLKTYLGGILLCAVGKDGDNQMFPIAWAVVEVENEECWTWFLGNLLEDLAISDGNGWTFISDQQKGLMNAVSKLAPLAEHRNCARHVYMNWKKNHKGTTLKNMFWRIVRSTYVQDYKFRLEELKSENVAAYDDFVARDVGKFCKAFLSLHTCSDMIDNNIAETFNGFILDARGMHIIHMCEEIRKSLMVRQVKKLKKMAFVHVWDLTGIPCVHACAAIHFQSEEPSAYVHPYYTVEMYLEAYKYALEPLVGEKMWPEVEGYTVQPPTIRKMPGRPKKVRRRDPGEDPKNPNKLKRSGFVMTCSNCRQKGHNYKTCTNEKVPPPPKGKRGRPRKYPSQPPRPQKRGKEKAATTSNMPRQSRVTHINRASSSTATKSNVTGAKDGPSTQESRTPAAGN